MRTISFNQDENNCSINGVEMTNQDFILFLGTHGFYYVRGSAVVNYFKSIVSLSQLSEEQLHTSLQHFSSLSRWDKDRLGEAVEEKRRYVENLTETPNILSPT